jgi:hypothetical protein
MVNENEDQRREFPPIADRVQTAMGSFASLTMTREREGLLDALRRAVRSTRGLKLPLASVLFRGPEGPLFHKESFPSFQGAV